MGIDIETTKNFIKSRIKKLKKSDVSDNYIAGQISAYQGVLDFIAGQEEAKKHELKKGA